MEFAPLLFWVHVKKIFLFKIFLDKAAPPPLSNKKQCLFLHTIFILFSITRIHVRIVFRNITEKERKLGFCCLIAEIYSGIIQVASTGKNQCTSDPVIG